MQALFSSSFYRSGEIRLRFFIPPLYATNALFRTIPKCNEQNVMHYKIRCHSSRVLAQSRTRIKFQACFPYTFVVAGAGWFGFVRARELVQIFICLYFIKSSFRNECEHSKNVTASNGNKKKNEQKNNALLERQTPIQLCGVFCCCCCCCSSFSQWFHCVICMAQVFSCCVSFSLGAKHVFISFESAHLFLSNKSTYTRIVI